MTHALPSVPFWTYDDHEEIFAYGLARIEADGLNLEFQLTDSEEKLLKEIHHASIRVDDLDAVHFSRNIFGAKLTLRVHRLGLLEEIPDARPGECTLRFKRKFRDEAQALAAQLQLLMSERKLKQIDEQMRDLDDA